MAGTARTTSSATNGAHRFDEKNDARGAEESGTGLWEVVTDGLRVTTIK